MRVWALWNQTFMRFYVVADRLEVFDEDEAFALACSWTCTGPFGGPVWISVAFDSFDDADDAAWTMRLSGAYDSTRRRRRERLWVA